MDDKQSSSVNSQASSEDVASMPAWLKAVRWITVSGFVILLFTVYILRAQVVEITAMKYRVEDESRKVSDRRYEENFELRKKDYELQKQAYQMRVAHYNKMVKRFQEDYDTYRKERHPEAPIPPRLPEPPSNPEEQKKVRELTTEFIAHRFGFYTTLYILCFVNLLGAAMLVGGIVTLILFERPKGRLAWLGLLVLSFVFLIGPAFHTILSALVGWLKIAPAY